MKFQLYSLILIYFVYCDWEIYKHELFDIATSVDWIGLNSDSSISSLTQINPSLCTPTSSTYLAGGKNKIWRKINMPTNRNFSAIRIELDFYYIDQMKDVLTKVYLNQVIISENIKFQEVLSTPTPLIYCNKPGNQNSADSSLIKLTYVKEFREDQIEIVIESIGQQPVIIYALSGFYLYVQFCDNYCEICNDTGYCERCKDDFKLIRGQCLCSFIRDYRNSLFQLENSGLLQCLNSCPNGYVPDENGICQLGTQHLLFNDLIGDFDSYLFYIIKDKYFSDIYDNSQRIIQIGNQKVAGPFFYNEQIVFPQLSIVSFSKIMIKLRIYFLRYQYSKSIGGQIQLKFNNYTVLYIYDYDSPGLYYQQGIAHINNLQSCEFKNSDCFQSDIYFEMLLNYEVTEITFAGQFTIIEPLRGWCLSNLEILEQQITMSQNLCYNDCLTCPFMQPKFCNSCKLGYFFFANKCLSKCPLQTILIGSECVENGMSGSYKYILNILYDDNNYDDEIQNLSYNERVDPKISKFIYNLNTYSILGGISIWSYGSVYHIIKSERPFYKAYIKLNVICIDLKYDNIFEIFVNATGITYQITTASPNLNQFQFLSIGNIMGSSLFNEYLAEVYIELPTFQSLDNLLLTFSIQKLQDWHQYYGIFNYRVMVIQCPEFCNKCNSAGQCQNWMIDISLQSGSCVQGYYYDHNLHTCSQCNSGCQQCTNSYYCDSCSPSYILIHGQCYCQDTYELSNKCTYTYPCHKGCLVCGFEIEQNLKNRIQKCLICDDSNHYWLNINECTCLEGYYMENQICQPCSEQCKTCIKSPRICTKCDSSLNRVLNHYKCECFFGYYQQEPYIECFKCNTTCQTCQFQPSFCTSCFIDQFRYLFSNQCLCKDGYFDQGIEICNECDQKCKTCSDINTCLSCYEDQYRKLNLMNTQCICQQGYFEIENKLECDSCHISCEFCLNSSLINMCTRCPITREPSQHNTVFQCVCKRGYYESNMKECFSCKDYIDPSISHYCYSNCGDKIVQWNEDCDDGNHSKDECISCIFSHSYCFNSLCTLCEMGQCKNCIDGYYLNLNNHCDKCDSYCKTCQIKANNCQSCILYNENLSCIICESRLGYQIKDGICQNICGDGLQVDNEQCDDGNENSGDGCFNCLIEDGWTCQDICELLNYPYLIFEEDIYDNLYQKQRNFIIKSNIPLKTSVSFTQICQFKMKDSKIFEINKNQDLTNYFDDYNMLLINVEIILNDRDENPILICLIENPQNYQSKQGLTFKQLIFQFEILKYLKPSQEVINVTQGIIDLNKYVLYILLGLAAFSLIIGGLHIFWNLLDILQLISYLQFFNIIYPYNVDTYFRLFDFAQFDFLKIFLNIEDLVNNYVSSPDPHFKFVLKGYSSTFYINAFAVFIAFVTTLSIYIICIIGFRILTKIMAHYSEENLYIDDEDPELFKYIILRIIRKVQRVFLKIIHYFGSGLLRTFMSVAYEYNLAIFLQLSVRNIQNPFLTSSFIVSIIFLLIQLYFIIKGFFLMSNQLFYFKQQYVKQKYGALFEGIQIRKQQPYSNYYNLILLCKKCFVIVKHILLFYHVQYQMLYLSYMLNQVIHQRIYMNIIKYQGQNYLFGQLSYQS
ncbi:unnamed protein product [Paramecium pentaurelia]|uniref:EGF-like domain-containing protein n=1 Tax=Paramecium pentaurelia TaxID=43138 RepID=A0A8S1TVX8_9CILI|nr:unnamed protein product [Paramecium pentaurelia]